MPEDFEKMKLSDVKDPKLRARIIQLDQEQNPNHSRLGGLEAKKPQPNLPPTLARGVGKFKISKGCLVVCTLTAHRRRLIDDDNCVASLKPLRDGVSESLGIDDGDSRIRFQCHQLLTIGKEGVTVTIERL